MADDPARLQDDDFARLVERVVNDPRLLTELTDRLSRRKGFQRQLAGVMQVPQGPDVQDADGQAEPGRTSTDSPEPARPSARQPQAVLDRSVVSSALIDWLAVNRAPGSGAASEPFPVIVDLNLQHSGSRQETSRQLQAMIAEVAPGAQVNTEKSRLLPQYLFMTLTRDDLTRLVQRDANPGGTGYDASQAQRQRTMHRIWPDFPLQATLHRTGATIKAEAARVSFAAAGQDIVWAVLDSGIDGQHPHFRLHANLDVAPLQHQDFTGTGDALVDAFGHGTHVAGIIAGAWPAQKETDDPAWRALHAMVAFRDDHEDVEYRELPLPRLSGVAPQCRLVSYKVLDAQGRGNVSNLLAALAHLQEVNGNGKLLQVHGVNISIGHGFDPEWFACGQSPLCVEVDRLVRSVVVVLWLPGTRGTARSAASCSARLRLPWRSPSTTPATPSSPSRSVLPTVNHCTSTASRTFPPRARPGTADEETRAGQRPRGWIRLDEGHTAPPGIPMSDTIHRCSAGIPRGRGEFQLFSPAPGRSIGV